jgi:hypothetical protein
MGQCKTCFGNKQDAWRKANPEKVKAQSAAYYKANSEKVNVRTAACQKANPERCKAYAAKYYNAHPERLKARWAAYDRAHRDERKAYRKAWFKTHREVSRVRGAAYRKANPEKVKAAYAVYRKRNPEKVKMWSATHSRTIGRRYGSLLKRHKKDLAPQGCTGTPMTKEEHRAQLFFKDGRERVCFYCHHENNKAGAGLDRLDNSITYTVKNTVPACRGCNVWRGRTHTVQETLTHFKYMRDGARKAAALKVKR